MNQLTEEKQAFGLLVVKVISPEETYSYLLTTFPIALSDSSGELQQSQKVPFKIIWSVNLDLRERKFLQTLIR